MMLEIKGLRQSRSLSFIYLIDLVVDERRSTLFLSKLNPLSFVLQVVCETGDGVVGTGILLGTFEFNPLKGNQSGRGSNLT